MTSKHAIHYSSKSAEHYTPKHVLDLVVECLGSISLDPCSNSKTDPNVPAARCFTKEDDGLNQPWAGRVFMNPVYGREVGYWIRKLRSEHEAGRVTESITLVAARVDTAWWRALVAAEPESYPIWCAVKGRLTFGGNTDPAQFPSAIVYIGREPGKFASVFQGIGAIWEPWTGHLRGAAPAE